MVNTFLPYDDFYDSAKVLDMKRLGKQRVEAMQLVNANLGLTVGWRNHPCAVMWRGHEDALAMYGPAKDVIVIGPGKSELDNYLNAALKRQGRHATPEPTPEKGFYYRSDHFSLAKHGVPMVYFETGQDLVKGGLAAGRAAADATR